MFKYSNVHRCVLSFFFGIFFLCNALNADSQNTSSRFFDIPNSLNRELGEMSKDEQGFIWFITNQGLCRYDGNDVKLVEYKKIQLPTNSTPNHLLCYNNLLICTQATKAYIFNKVTSKSDVYQLNSWISKIYINTIGQAVFITYSGQVWIYTSKFGMQQGINFFNYAGGEKPSALLHLNVDEQNNFFLFYKNNRFAKFHGKKFQWSGSNFFNQKGVHTNEQFIKMSASTNRFVAILFDNGNMHLYDKQTMRLIETIIGKSIACLLSIKNQLVIVPSKGLKKTTIPISDNYTVIDYFFKDQLKVSAAVLVDKNKQKTLLSTNYGLIELSGLLNKNTDNIFQQNLVEYFKNTSIRSIYKVGEDILLGTYSGFYYCSKKSIQLLSKEVVYSIQLFDHENLILAIEGATGLAKYHIASKRIVLMPNLRFQKTDFHVTTLFNSGKEWLCGSFNHVFSIKDSLKSWAVTPLELSGEKLGAIRKIIKIRNALFVACQDGIFKIAKSAMQKIYPKNGAMRISAVLEAKDGIWLGTYGEGLIKINDEGKLLQQIGFNEGLVNNFVYSMVLSDSAIIAGTGAGVSILSIQGMPHFLQLKSESGLNGLFNQEFNHSAFFHDSLSNQVILGGVNGLFFVDAKARVSITDTATRKIQLAYIKSGSTNAKYQLDLFALLRESIQVSSVNSSINLKFVCVNEPTQSDALFRIKGLSEQWQNIKLKEEVNIYSLPPGKYTIEVKLPYDNKAAQWFSKPLIVTPAYYQTYYFKFLILLVFIVLGYSIWRSRVKKIKKEYKIRTLIASDLHDDIGSTLNSISVYSSIAENQLGNNLPQAKVLLEKMGAASREMIEKMSDIVWAIHPKNDAFDKVLDRIRFFAAELLSTKNIVFNFKVEDYINELKFEMEVRKNIYLICKEAINNAYKYAEAANIRLGFKKEGNTLLVEIADDGIGFDATILPNQGNGLFNMKARAKEINAVLTIQSSSYNGTSILLKIHL